MFEVTIKGDSLSALATAVLSMAAQFQTTVPEAEDAKPKATRAKKAAPAPEPEPEVNIDVEEENIDWTAEGDIEPMPDTAKAIVDAGTGKPAAATPETPIKMTFDDVKAAAAKLAAKDMAKLAALLKKHGGAKLSEVPPGNLGAFASDVMEALG